MIVLVGCQSDQKSTPVANNFSLHVDAPEDLQAGELFIITGTLVNQSDNTWDIQHGAAMFTYDVFDSNGDEVSQGIEPLMFESNVVRIINDIGFIKSLQPQEQYSNDGEDHVSPKNNKYILPTGNYTIVSKAKFRIPYDGTGYEFEIESEPLSIKVT